MEGKGIGDTFFGDWSNKAKIEIIFSSLKCDHFTLELNPQDTVEDVKKTIETVKGFPASQQRLLRRWIPLKDEMTLEDSQVSHGSHIVIRLLKPKVSSSGASTASAPPLSTTPVVSAATRTTPPAVAFGEPDANPLDLFPQGMGSNASDGALDLVRNSRQFRELRAVVQNDPKILQHMLRGLAKENPNSVQLIREHQADLFRLINESIKDKG